MKIKSIIFILIASFSMSYAIFNSKENFAVISHNATIYKNFMNNDAVGVVELGVPVAIKSRKGVRVQFEYKGNDVWINQQDISEINFEQKNFSSTSSKFTPLPVVKNDSICFVYDDKLYTMNISNPESLKAKAFSSVPQFSQISISENRNVLFLTGDIVSNNTTTLNLAFYNISERKFYPLTFLLGSQVIIESSEFSQDGKYLSLFFDVNDENIVHVYDVKTQKLVLVKRDVLNVSWFRSILFLSTPNEIIYYTDLDTAQGKVLHTFSKPIETAISSVVIAGEYFLQIQDTIYRFDGDSLQKTDFSSLERSPRGNIEYYSRNDQFYTMYNHQRLRSFSGSSPRWTLLSILDDENILYRYTKDAIQMFSIYNAVSDQSYTYYWIEDPFHTFRNGVSLEYVVDGEEIWIFLEKADDFIKASRIKNIIN